MKNLMCQFGTETNTFAKGYMEFEQQAPCGWIRADAIVTADTPGLRSDPRLFTYQHVLRPIFPLDEDTEYTGRWPQN